MSVLIFHLICSISVLSFPTTALGSCASLCPHQFFQQSNRRFELKTDRFWVFSEEADRWIEVHLPYDLKQASGEDWDDGDKKGDDNVGQVYEVLPQRKRLSLTKLSESSVWVTGESGSIYERFWNGLQWVFAPHELPIQAGRAIAVFVINQTILALSEAGLLYQMQVQLSESSETVWAELTPALNHITDRDAEQNHLVLMKSGVVSQDGQRAYFCTQGGMLIELAGIDPPRWISHGQPAGANVAAIADAASTRAVVYTISSSGDLYEYDRNSKPSWKRHIWQGIAKVAPLIPSKGCTSNGLMGAYSESLFLLTKAGTLVERRLQQRKWKWVVHGSPKHQNLTSITPALQDESSDQTSISLFFSTSSGSVFEYRVQKESGTAQNSEFPGSWVNHVHPVHAKAARGIAGLQLQVGRILFLLDDGRLGELHLLGLGGEISGPTIPQNTRRKVATSKYVWSILDVPESEGWNAEYCTQERGPRNCITGIKDESKKSGITSATGRRKHSQAQEYYLSPGTIGAGGELTKSSVENNFPVDGWIVSNFRLRLMYEGKSIFLLTGGGLIFEYICVEDVWIWLRHESSTTMKGILGNYNGSLFMVDTHGSLLLRERNGYELSWKNCSAMRKGTSIVAGQPWDGMPGKAIKVTAQDALFFVSKKGTLLQFVVSMRKFKWKDCRKPANTKVASIVDQGLLRENIVFVAGRNGRLYQYNKVTDIWHEHYQSQHLILSNFLGTAIRPSSTTLSGSLFMLSREGGLVEYHWNSWHGWNWVEHGTPYKDVTLVGSPGPCFDGNQLFLIGSDGKVYLRYKDKTNTWKWKDFGFPVMESKMLQDQRQQVCSHEDSILGFNEDQDNCGDCNIKCDPKVASTRPIPFSNRSVIFELRDGRLAEIELAENREWEWSRVIGTPTSSCLQNYWATLAS
ncbi:uncharacterized protein LOC129319007 isoform X2 [Prosopis cineraria]|uniref:uncharacterized protein LOC129319007 isoform X2 n=1 Tax=Prosopis cineraria TaxID=364024 RepID=UPI002410AE8F|nr:uncharacterized protein LOC129319007 isoform X2 [Prosopis cineraria]